MVLSAIFRARRFVSRFKDGPITQRRMALYRGVVSTPFDSSAMAATDLNRQAIELLKSHGLARPGEHVILTRDDHMNAHRSTNTMKVLERDA